MTVDVTEFPAFPLGYRMIRWRCAGDGKVVVGIECRPDDPCGSQIFAKPIVKR